jgi:thioredoxin reductase (NADPH)
LSQNSKINLIHRRDGFSGAQASVDKVKELEKAGKNKFIYSISN